MSSTKVNRRTYTKDSFVDDEVVVDNEKLSDVFVNDQTTQLVNLHFSRQIQTITLLAPVAVGDRTCTVQAGVAPTVGHHLCFKEDINHTFSEILSFVDNGGGSYTVTLDTPFDRPYTVAGGCSQRSTNMAVNGSVTPVEFNVSPSGLAEFIEWDITNLHGVIWDDVAMDDGKFGGRTSLPRGLVAQYRDGFYKTLFNCKNNGELALRCDEALYVDWAPAGQYGFRFQLNLAGPEKHGVALRINNADEIVVIVQDDLTALIDFQMVAHGHRTDRLE